MLPHTLLTHAAGFAMAAAAAAAVALKSVMRVKYLKSHGFGAMRLGQGVLPERNEQPVQVSCELPCL